MKERRSSQRTRLDILLNKYIDGYPYTCCTVDISADGVLLRCISEPAAPHQSCALEFGLPGQARPIWVWATTVWKRGNTQALRFVSIDKKDRASLQKLISERAA